MDPLSNCNETMFDEANFDELSFPISLRVIATLICVFLLVIGCIGNAMIPFVVLRNKDLRNSTNIFLINLSVADLLLLSFCAPTSLIELNSRPEVWFLGEFMCQAVSFVDVERFYAICRPLQAGYKCTKKRAIVIIMVIWSISTISSLPLLLITEMQTVEYIDGTSVNTCVNSLKTDWHPSYYIIILICFFCVPFIVLVYIYLIIAIKLFQESQKLSQCSRLKKQNQIRRQVVIMLVSVCLTFFTCLLPFRLMTLWILLSTPETIKNLGMESYYTYLYFCRIMLYFNSSVNPILYNVISTKFRKGFYSALGFRCRQKANICSQSNTVSMSFFKNERHSPILVGNNTHKKVRKTYSEITEYVDVKNNL
ncbi:neuropeptide GPCR A6b-like protein [Leptotrombidium deliense]|uniref:Neuropeptide GPCR A6b-like protein n=1 Tax=Leptotrombidium deliense TaxID=299467 RepID=A0A443SS42_9ACAR|nr:neuropeptide GPCR A6b-like protein [Leptotrombidium deliense]